MAGGENARDTQRNAEKCVNVFSGLTGSGKSHLLQKILECPEFSKAAVVRMDEIGARFWGGRQAMASSGETTELTRTEKLYRNELTRQEIKTQLVVYGADTVLVEVPLLTRRDHQGPLVDMARSAERLLRRIVMERAERHGVMAPELPRVRLRVVLLYASTEVTRLRMERRAGGGGKSDSDALGFRVFIDASRQFQIPTAYVPLPVNTSDDSFEADQRRIHEILSFFRGDHLNKELVRKRLREVRAYLEEAKALAVRG